MRQMFLVKLDLRLQQGPMLRPFEESEEEKKELVHVLMRVHTHTCVCMCVHV